MISDVSTSASPLSSFSWKTLLDPINHPLPLYFQNHPSFTPLFVSSSFRSVGSFLSLTTSRIEITRFRRWWGSYRVILGKTWRGRNWSLNFSDGSRWDQFLEKCVCGFWGEGLVVFFLLGFRVYFYFPPVLPLELLVNLRRFLLTKGKTPAVHLFCVQADWTPVLLLFSTSEASLFNLFCVWRCFQAGRFFASLWRSSTSSSLSWSECGGSPSGLCSTVTLPAD